MTILLAIIGAIIGGILTGLYGVILGGGAGWLLGSFFDLQERLARLEEEMAGLRGRVAREEVGTPENPTAGEFGGYEPGSPTPGEYGRHATPGASATEPERPSARQEFTFHEQPARPLPERNASFPPELSPVFAIIRSFVTGGNLLVKTGMVIVFFGVSFLVKYAAEHGLLPIQLRLAASALGGVSFLFGGWHLRQRRAEYALTLQGGGIGVLYLTIYATFRLYHLIPALPAFGLLVAVAVLCGALAVTQNSMTLALFGICGGFLAPLLASTGQGSHVVLFGYYVVLNAGIIGIAWFKSWRHLNLAGFIFTFFIGALWGASYYHPSFFSSTEPFLVLFFLIYVSVAVLFAIRQPPELKGYLDGGVIFGTPIVSFALQAALVADYRYGLAWSALAVGVFYLLLSWVLARQESALHSLAEAFRAFGVIFLTLSVPLACDGRWTAAAWAVEGAAIAWVGIRQQRRAARYFGILLQAGAGAAFCSEFAASVGPLPVLNSYYPGCLLISLSGLWSAYELYRANGKVAEWERDLSHLLIGWGLFWWLGGGLNEIGRHLPEQFLVGGRLIFIATTCAICHLLERRLVWPPLGWPALGIVPALWCFAIAGLSVHPLESGGWLGWPAAFALLYLILYLRDGEHPELLSFLHGAALWLAAIIVTWELGWQIRHFIGSAGCWLTVSRGIVPAAVLLALAQCGSRLAWPVRRHESSYYFLAAVPLAVWSWLWIVWANLTNRGDPAPFPWVLLLNALDLVSLLSLTALALWYRRSWEFVPDALAVMLGSRIVICYAAGIFLWINAILVRALHHWGGVPFNLASMFDSRLVQTSFAIFWSLLALCAMVFSTRRGERTLWLAGACLLGIVVVKLFLVDLAGQGSIERIVSFVAVGLLLLVIGWFSPVPPRT
jgi:uncharacterized membrane protein